MDDSEVKDWLLLVLARDRPGALARITDLFHDLAVNLDFVLFDSLQPGTAYGMIVCATKQSAIDSVGEEIRGFVDIISVDVAPVGGSGARSSSPDPSRVLTPRDLDDVLDQAVEELPPYSKDLARRLRGFQVDLESVGVSPALAREAAAHIERIEAEKVLLARVVATRTASETSA